MPELTYQEGTPDVTVESFAKMIKEKHPYYANVPDQKLVTTVLQKYPYYRDKIKASTILAGQKAALHSEFEKAQPESTIGTRTREAAIGVLEPFTAQNILSSAKQLGSALWQTALHPSAPTELLDLAKGAVTAPAQPVINYVNAVREGDWDKAANASGGILSQTVPAVEGAYKGVKAGVSGVTGGDAARQFAQNRVGANAMKTTEPMVEKYNTGVADTAAKQAEQAVAHKEDLSQTVTANREAAHTNARTEAVNRSIEEGSKRLGESVKDLDLKLREEANGKYQTVKDAVKDDPGVPLADMAKAAREAEAKLKGSTENIKQFRELIRKAPEESGIQTSVGELKPGDQLYDLLKSQGAIDTGGALPFDELQGYSSEIGQKIAQGRGEMPGDVYHALKYLKEKIDTAKTAVADRNGAGATLRNADSFWHNYQDLFYDKDSAIAKVRESVGVKNPAEAANEFFRGNANEIAIGKLKGLRSVYSPDASAIADLTQNLKAAREEAGASKVIKPQPIPEAPKPIKGPETPTAESVVAEKRGKVLARGQSIGELHRGTVFELLSLPVKSLASNVLKRQAVVDWIAKPTAADLIAIDKLPEPVKTQVRTNLQQIMQQESAKGSNIKIAPAVRAFVARNAPGVSGTAVASGAAKNRREALQAIGRPTP